MRRPAAVVHVHPVRVVCKHTALRAKFSKKRLGRAARRTVGTVYAYLHPVKRKRHRAFNVVYIVAHCLRRLGYPADVAAHGRFPRPPAVAVKHYRLYLFFQRVRQLIPVAAENLYAVKLARVMRCRKHYACIRLILSHEERHRRGRHYAELNYVGPDRAQTRGHCVFEHIRRNTRVLAY